jgi:hypothetical protein
MGKCLQEQVWYQRTNLTLGHFTGLEDKTLERGEIVLRPNSLTHVTIGVPTFFSNQHSPTL